MFEKPTIKADQIIKKAIKISNDKRQFIIRIPTKISDKSILTDFKKKYKAEIVFDIKKNSEMIVRFKE